MLNRILFFFLCLAILPSCFNFGQGFDGGPIILSSVGEAPSADSSSEWFYVDIDEDKYRTANESLPYYEINTSDEIGDSASSRESLSNCEIRYNKDNNEATETKLCILDIPEHEFFTKPLHITFNIPSGMCENLLVDLPWHFDKESRYLEEIVNNKTIKQLILDYLADTSVTGESLRIVENVCQPKKIEIMKTDTTGNDTEGSESSQEVEIKESDIDIRGCCYGGIDGKKKKLNDHCLGGPKLHAEIAGKKIEDIKAQRVIKISQPLGATETIGIKQTITIPQLVESEGGNSLASKINPPYSTLPYANYLALFDVSDATALNYDTIQANAQNTSYTGAKIPQSLRQIVRTASPLAFFTEYNPQFFYQFACLDKTGEVLHEILLMVREWNTMEEFLPYYNAGGDTTNDPDQTGLEGESSGCEYETRFNTRSRDCNDLADFKDIGAGFPEKNSLPSDATE